MSYRILRFYVDDTHPTEQIASGLTLEQARAHCTDPATREAGVWFDGYEAEDIAFDLSRRTVTVARARQGHGQGVVIEQRPMWVVTDADGFERHFPTEHRARAFIAARSR